MRDYNVRNVNDAFVYTLDCNLATVAHMSMLKSKSKSEFQRQISIAQKMVDWACTYNLDYSTTRAHDVVNLYGGSVADWAAKS